MLTDWVIVRRLATELRHQLRGARVRDAGLVDDGRFAVTLAAPRETLALVFAPFASPPLVTLEEVELAIGVDPGYSRAIGASLRGLSLREVVAVEEERSLEFSFSARSRFGVVSDQVLVAELVPKFGNLLLLKDGVVVAAAKQFGPAQNATRVIEVGRPYVRPPLRGASVPSLLAESARVEGLDPSAVLASALAAADGLNDIFVYRRDGELVALHVVPLAQFAALDATCGPRVVSVLAEALHASRSHRELDAIERRRATLRKRLERRRASLRSESERLVKARDDASTRERLRLEGEALYAHAHEVPEGASLFVPPSRPELEIRLDPKLDAKANALKIFAQYRKASDSLPHLKTRIEALGSLSESLETLLWECERAQAQDLVDIERDVDALEGRPAAALRPRARSKRRAILAYALPSGARVLVGRSPRENVEITFEVARPEDLWFHARNVPGAHVILQPAPGASPADGDLAAAAALAALHSKAKGRNPVEVDYTERKYVRKRRKAPPGLVWYTNARTALGDAQHAPVEIAPPELR